MANIRDSIMFIFIITSKCNLTCIYCPPCGEGHTCNPGTLPYDVFEISLEVAKEAGIRAFRLTGGEPLLHPDICKMITHLHSNAINPDFYTTINSNGILLNKYIDTICDHGFNLIRVSLDSLNRAKNLLINGQDVTEEIVRGIVELRRRKIPVRINMVVMKSNLDQLRPILAFCRQHDVELKLLDLEKHLNMPPGFWESEYISTSNIKHYLSLNSTAGITVYPWGRLGNPMEDFIYKGVQLRLKDSTVGSTYISFCEKCPMFPCPEGIYGITITPDQRVLWCRRRADTGYSFSSNKESAKAALAKAMEKLEEVHFVSFESTNTTQH